MTTYTYQKAPVDADLLRIQINAFGDISQNVDGIVWNAPDALSIFFANDLEQGEKVALDAIVTEHDVSGGGHYEENHCRQTKASGNIVKEEWLEICDDQGNLSGLARSIDYAYSRARLLSSAEKIYFKNGTVSDTVNYQYITVNGNAVKRKV